MAKTLTRYVCNNCGATQVKWLGKCPACNSWNTLEEEVVARAEAKAVSKVRRTPSKAQPIGEVPPDTAERRSTGLTELDRVLGGGVVAGSVTLVGGDPGVGKSTLLLQALSNLAQRGLRVLYVSGEESAAQTALRARRLGVHAEGLLVLAANDLLEVMATVRDEKVQVVVVDSVQTVRSPQLESAAGTVSQLREVTSRLVELAKSSQVATFLVGHVTKDGSLAGPKVLEHLVDTVLGFEGERGHAFRALRTLKNRFGSATEVGLFEMTQEGLRQVTQPSALFLAERPEGQSGSVVAATSEGARSLLVEVQALVGTPGAGTPRRTAAGCDGGRLALILAVLAKRADVETGASDVFLNLAGGLRVDEPALDLPMALAVASSYRERPFPSEVVAFGELGLAGEVRGVSRAGPRLAEAKAMGFKRAILPASSAERLTASEGEGLELLPVRTIAQALDLLLLVRANCYT